ncbi:MAG: hypothetical protein WBF34_17890 [Streptosporangiaceae bacterium]
MGYSRAVQGRVDTRIPHAYINTGEIPVELLIIFGPQGERVHLRARTGAETLQTPGP